MEPSIWMQMINSLRAPEAKATTESSAFTNPNMKDAQARATAYYFQTGEERPLQDFIKDKKLGGKK